MIFYIGIDDTDNKESRGTGYKSRILGELLEQSGLGKLKSISRHQLFVHPDIPYTSQNSSACIEFESNKLEELKTVCRNYMIENSEIGSDSGLCIAEDRIIKKEIKKYGLYAKIKVLDQETTWSNIKDSNIYLEGFTGTKGGIIGALAAVGLKAGGNDGRFIWLRGLRDLKHGIYTSRDLFGILDIDIISTFDGKIVGDWDQIFVTDWVRPVLKNYKKTLIVEEVNDYGLYQWETAGRNFIRSIS